MKQFLSNIKHPQRNAHGELKLYIYFLKTTKHTKNPKLGIVAHTVIPSLGRLRQKDWQF
jgi:hypothetical protein